MGYHSLLHRSRRVSRCSVSRASGKTAGLTKLVTWAVGLTGVGSDFLHYDEQYFHRGRIFVPGGC